MIPRPGEQADVDLTSGSMNVVIRPPPADTTSGLLGDDPVDDEGADLLRRGAFAGRVTNLIDHISQETPSAVLALLGPWGSGKTSVLNFVRRRLESRGRWRVVEFNPWTMSDLPSVVQEFFTTLMTALPEDRKGKRLRRKMAAYAKAVSPLAAPFKVFGISAEQAVRAAGDLLAGDQSLEARRKELEEALRAHDKPILLIADDIDRLHPDELTLIFKLVRLVGRLPKVYYLLAFDEKTVLDVLTSTQLAGGDRPRALAYLEKMVQLRLDLPPVHPRLAGQLLDQLLDALISKYSVELDDRAAYRLSQAYRTHLVAHLHEPRQVKRYSAQIEALYPLVASEVDFVDFAIITFLRTFHPGVENMLTAHKAELTGTAIEVGNKPSHEQRRDTWRGRLTQVGVAEADLAGVLELLGQLFLPIKSALQRMEYGSRFYPELAAARRVGSAEYFDRYFHLGIGPDDLPDATVAAALTEVLDGSPVRRGQPLWRSSQATPSWCSTSSVGSLRRRRKLLSASCRRLLRSSIRSPTAVSSDVLGSCTTTGQQTSCSSPSQPILVPSPRSWHTRAASAFSPTPARSRRALPRRRGSRRRLRSKPYARRLFAWSRRSLTTKRPCRRRTHRACCRCSLTGRGSIRVLIANVGCDPWWSRRSGRYPTCSACSCLLEHDRPGTVPAVRHWATQNSGSSIRL